MCINRESSSIRVTVSSFQILDQAYTSYSNVVQLSHSQIVQDLNFLRYQDAIRDCAQRSWLEMGGNLVVGPQDQLT
jgi:hypothetical protein